MYSTFGGWKDSNNNLIDENTTVTGDVTYYSNGVVTLFDKGQVSKMFHSQEDFIRYYEEMVE